MSSKGCAHLENKKRLHLLLVIMVILIAFIVAPKWTVGPTHTTPSPTPFAHTLNLMAVGDIMMHSPQVTAGKTSTGYDFRSFFQYIAPTLEKADLVFGNLETPLAGPQTGFTGYPMFNAPDEYADALKASHFNVLTTANNHALDRREAGILRTIEQLNQRGISHTGTFQTAEARNQPLIIEKNNIKLGILAYTYGTNGMTTPAGRSYLVNRIDKQLMQQDIAKAKAAGVDLVVVAMHFGNEYQRKPSTYQKDNVDFLFSAGADIILGSHPHVVQPYEIRTIPNADGTTRKGVVIYSLGNFISNQRDNPTDIGGILSINIVKSDNKIDIKETSFIPTYVHRYYTGSKRVYNVIPMEQTIMKHNYRPFTEADYTRLKSRYEEMMVHAVSAP